MAVPDAVLLFATGLTVEAMSCTMPRVGLRARIRSIHWPDKSLMVPRPIACRSDPSGSAKPHSPGPLCRRRSSASVHIRQGDQIPTGGTTRPMRADHSCQCVHRPERHLPSRSSRLRCRVHDKRAAQHRRSLRATKLERQAAVKGRVSKMNPKGSRRTQGPHPPNSRRGQNAAFPRSLTCSLNLEGRQVGEGFH
jgi:hypothetical protein